MLTALIMAGGMKNTTTSLLTESTACNGEVVARLWLVHSLFEHADKARKYA